MTNTTTRRPKANLVSVKILKEDVKKIKLWAIQREMKFYEIINKIINQNV